MEPPGGSDKGTLTGRSLSKCFQRHPRERAPSQSCRNDLVHLVDQYTLKRKGVYQAIMGLLFSRSVMPNPLQPRGLQPTRLFCPWDFLGKNTGVGCHFLTQGLNPHLLLQQVDSLPLSHVGSPTGHQIVLLGGGCNSRRKPPTHLMRLQSH